MKPEQTKPINISAVIKSIRNIMRKDKGINGDAQRIEQLGWMLFLKIFDAKDLEKEDLDETGNYVSPFLNDSNGEIGRKTTKESRVINS